MNFIYFILPAFLFVSSFSFLEGKNLPVDFSQKNKPATIKVLIAKQKEDVILEVKGRYHIYNPADNLLVDTGTLSKRAFIRIGEKGMTWGDNLPLGMSQFRIVPGDSQSILLVDGIQYRGCIEAYNEKEKISVINEVDVETYLKATLAPLFPHEKNQEFLDAVAITARTHTYYLLSRNSYALWHVEAAEVGYQGVGLSHQNNYLDRAVEATRQMVLTYQDIPFASTWTKDSAGKTAPFSVIFRKESPSPQGVTSSVAMHNREKRRWSLTVSKEQLAKIADAKYINGVDLFLDQNSGKVYALRIHDGMATKDVDFFTLQKELTPQKLRSNDFTLEVKNDNILITGYGEGHGVGLCLFSAKQMAEHGEKAPKILSTFFPETELKRQREVE